MILYLHGFGSVGGGTKTKVLKSIFPDQKVFSVTYTPHDPETAIKYLAEVITRLMEQCEAPDELMLVGTSMGGFYAYYFGEKFSLKNVLINPVTDLAAIINEFVGSNQNYVTGDNIEVTTDHLNSAKKLDRIPYQYPTSSTLVLLDMGDDVLDAGYTSHLFKSGSLVKMYNGGSHRFEHMEQAADLLIEHFNSFPV